MSTGCSGVDVRIIAGMAKGRRLDRPAAGTRPFTDRNRESLFSSLGAAVEDAVVLDLYAGVGSLGLEALSRGAAAATFIERNRPAVAILERNVTAVGLGGKVIAADVSEFLATDPGGYDLVFVDPPYGVPLASVEEVLAKLVDRLNPNAIVVVHRRSGEAAPEAPPTLALSWERRKGDAQIWRYTREADS
jgi:16S rRNA (guanine966-N2)-methyltransferase